LQNRQPKRVRLLVIGELATLMQLDEAWVGTLWKSDSKTEYFDEEEFSSQSSRKDKNTKKLNKTKNKSRWFHKMEVLYSYFSSGK
jgi:hypothetical protein